MRLVPWQAPCQRASCQPGDGFAVRRSGPGANPKRQRLPQLIPVGRLVTVPEPTFRTVSVTSVFVNAAVMVVSALTMSEQVGLAPVQPPPTQPEKVDPPSGVAVRVTVSPCRNSPKQVKR